MADCECINGCPFFNDRMDKMPAMASVYKKNYCQSDFNSCARYSIFKALGKEFVPVDLFPNEKEMAEMIIKKAKS
ncbi:MAG: hypothetical protein JXR63_03110 [Spirochaetales bacterium]|nr:hypothetical protein [Spirochaetales bacterium]